MTAIKENDVKIESTMLGFKKLVTTVGGMALVGSTILYAEIDIRYGSTLGADNRQSDGSSMDTAFTFQLGTFDGAFTPTSSNTDLWLDNWVEAPNSATNLSGGSSAPYTQVPLGPVTTNRFDGTTRLDGNPTNFSSTDQAYIWGYDDRSGGSGDGLGEWILLTNTGWLFPNDPGSGVNFGPDFLTSDAGTTAVVGSVNPNYANDGDDPHLVTDSILMPVPEPGTAILLCAGIGVSLLRRRR